jgi:uncharacterized membrane protein YqjE
MIGASPTAIAARLDRLSTDLVELIRDEVALAKQEMAEKARAAALGVALAAGAAMLGSAGLILLLVVVVLALSTAMPLWLACSLVAVGTLTTAAVLGLTAIGILRRVSPVPERTIAGIRGDVEWLGRRVNESL